MGHDAEPKVPKVIRNAEEMLAEALYTLCRAPDASPSREMSYALSLLREFEVDDSRSRADVESDALTNLLKLGIGVEQHEACKDQLRGFVDRHAEAEKEEEHWFCPANLVTELQLRGRHARVEQQVADLWQAWRRAAEQRQRVREESTPRSRGLQDQPWPEVQAEAATQIVRSHLSSPSTGPVCFRWRAQPSAAPIRPPSAAASIGFR